MNNALLKVEIPQNEPIKSYLSGTPERNALEAELKRQASNRIEIPLIIGGKEVRTGKIQNVVMPHDHGHVLATCHMATEREVRLAIEAALEAKRDWMTMSWNERMAIQLKAAELLAKKDRYVVNAATMLGQSKNAFQAEIDAACEAIDYFRYNAHFVTQIYGTQPRSTIEQLNWLEYRPLEGFVLTVSPFNFTAIASNLSMSVVLMGNTVVWKPATTSLLSNYYLMKVYHEAGLPDGVVNFVPGSGAVVGDTAVVHPDLGGVHFTGSNGTFNHIWKKLADNLKGYRSYPRLVGETGGKNFIFVHASADPREVATAFMRGSFEYQGQKCSASSRGYIPRSLWPEIRSLLVEMVSNIHTGDVRDFDNFVNAVIDERAYDSIMGYLERAKKSPAVEILTGGNGDKSKGYFVEPTILVTSDPHFATMEEEIFGPVVTLYVYEDQDYLETLELCDKTSPYALTGAVFSSDRAAMVKACQVLRYAAGNFYCNDKPTGAMVGMQPFGGARASGTNDKAGGLTNLLRWTSPRTIKETFLPATDFRYDYMSH